MASFWQNVMVRLINFYPPLHGAGIRSRFLDEFTIEVELRRTLFNGNVMGVHFGGSLYSMCDPWFMLLLMKALGDDYIVWDKAAGIQFIRPGRGKVKALFHIAQERIDQLRQEADRLGKIEPTFSVDVFDEQGQVVAHVEKLLYIRKRTDGPQNIK